MFREKRTTITTYHLPTAKFKKMRSIFCKWTNNEIEDIPNIFSAKELFELRSEFFKAVTQHLAATQQTLDKVMQHGNDENAKRVIRALIDKTSELEDDSAIFDELTDYDEPVSEEVTSQREK